jgi:hypothetical protein
MKLLNQLCSLVDDHKPMDVGGDEEESLHRVTALAWAAFQVLADHCVSWETQDSAILSSGLAQQVSGDGWEKGTEQCHSLLRTGTTGEWGWVGERHGTVPFSPQDRKGRLCFTYNARTHLHTTPLHDSLSLTHHSLTHHSLTRHSLTHHSLTCPYTPFPYIPLPLPYMPLPHTPLTYATPSHAPYICHSLTCHSLSLMYATPSHATPLHPTPRFQHCSLIICPVPWSDWWCLRVEHLRACKMHSLSSLGWPRVSWEEPSFPNLDASLNFSCCSLIRGI